MKKKVGVRERRKVENLLRIQAAEAWGKLIDDPDGVFDPAYQSPHVTFIEGYMVGFLAAHNHLCPPGKMP